LPENEIDAAAAAQAIEAAGGLGKLMADPEARSAPEPDAPAPTGTPAPGIAPVETPTLAEQPIAEFTQGSPDTPQFAENFDPNQLPPELVPAYRQMQADYTRKTQEAAPFRSLAEQFGELDATELAQAVETYQTLQDPSAWRQLHSELTEQLTTMGVPLGEAQSIAAEQVTTEQTAQANDPRAILSQLQDPEYAPLRSAFEGMFSELDSFKQEQQRAREQAQEEAAVQAMTSEIKRQENLLRTSRTDYTDDDFTAIYELSPVYGGNLIEAAKRYDSMLESRMERYIASKTAAAGNPGLAPLPGGEAPVTAGPDYNPATLEDPAVDAAVRERIAQIAALEAGGVVG
jgi:hypothetical protein